MWFGKQFSAIVLSITIAAINTLLLVPACAQLTVEQINAGGQVRSTVIISKGEKIVDTASRVSYQRYFNNLPLTGDYTAVNALANCTSIYQTTRMPYVLSCGVPAQGSATEQIEQARGKIWNQAYDEGLLSLVGVGQHSETIANSDKTEQKTVTLAYNFSYWVRVTAPKSIVKRGFCPYVRIKIDAWPLKINFDQLVAEGKEPLHLVPIYTTLTSNGSSFDNITAISFSGSVLRGIAKVEAELIGAKPCNYSAPQLPPPQQA